MMTRDQLLAALAREIAGRKELGKVMRVAIDGRCAAGKSTLANEVALTLDRRGLAVLRKSLDDFHHPRERRYGKGEYSAAGYYEDAYDYPAVIHYLLGVSADAILLFEGI